MNTPISHRDLESLSAYLDNQLSAGERARVEERLQHEPALRQTVEDLGRTRLALRAQLPLRAPRNFTLTPEMAGLRRTPATPMATRRSLPGAYPALRLTSALAAFFLVVIFAGQLILQSVSPGPAWVALMPAQPEAAQEAPQAVARDAQPAPVVAMSGGGSGAVEPAAPVPAPAQAIAKMAEPMTVTEGAMLVTPLGTMGLETLTPTGALQINQVVPSQAGEPDVAQTYQPAVGRGFSGWTLLWVIQLTLLALAVIAGAAALWMRRSARL